MSTAVRREIDRRAPWYPQDADALERAIAGWRCAADTRPGYGLIVPHAGYTYSGECANIAWSSVEIPSRVLILALDHRGSGRLDLWPGGPWETPLGDVPGATDLIDALAELPAVTVNTGNHPLEHSGDNQMPLLCHYRPDVSVAMLNVGVSAFHPQAAEWLDEAAAQILGVLRGVDERVLVAASSDLSHEQGPGNIDRVRSQDAAVRKALEAYDVDALRDTILGGATMCGSMPVGLMLRIARELGATACEVLDQRTSSDATGEVGDYVVGYLAARVV